MCRTSTSKAYRWGFTGPLFKNRMTLLTLLPSRLSRCRRSDGLKLVSCAPHWVYTPYDESGGSQITYGQSTFLARHVVLLN